MRSLWCAAEVVELMALLTLVSSSAALSQRVISHRTKKRIDFLAHVREQFVMKSGWYDRDAA